jgi:hypothetical protein
MEVAAPIARRERDGFLRSVAAELASYPPAQIGPGLVHQIAVRYQRRFLGPLPVRHRRFATRVRRPVVRVLRVRL